MLTRDTHDRLRQPSSEVSPLFAFAQRIHIHCLCSALRIEDAFKALFVNLP